GRYMPHGPARRKVHSQRWMTFVRNHAKAIIAADFFVVVTATFRFVYVLVVMEIETRRIVHLNVTRHPLRTKTLSPNHIWDFQSNSVRVRWRSNRSSSWQ